MPVLIASASSQGSDASVHLHSLARAFSAHIHIAWMVIKPQTKKKDL